MPAQPYALTDRQVAVLGDAMNESLRRFCGDECGGWCESPVDHLDAGDMGHFVPVPRADQVALLELVDALRDGWAVPVTPYLIDLLTGYGERLCEGIAYHSGPVVDHPGAWWNHPAAGMDGPPSVWDDGYIDGELERLHACRDLLRECHTFTTRDPGNPLEMLWALEAFRGEGPAR